MEARTLREVMPSAGSAEEQTRRSPEGTTNTKAHRLIEQVPATLVGLGIDGVLGSLSPRITNGVVTTGLVPRKPPRRDGVATTGTSALTQARSMSFATREEALC